MAATPRPRRPSRLTWWLARRLWPHDSMAQATQDVIQLDSVLRFAAIYALTVFAPALILAWLGISTSRGSEQAIVEEVEQEARNSVEAALRQVEAAFEHFESSARSRVRRGLSPAPSLLELSPYLLLAVRLDNNGNVVAPFREAVTETPVDRSFYFSDPFAAARRAERQNRWAEAYRLYGKAADESRGMMLEGMSAFQQARVLAFMGHVREAESLYADVVADYSEFRDLWGFPLGDLAQLKRGELLLEREPEIGEGALLALVEEILLERWVIGLAGGEAAIARRALLLVESYANADSLASLRNRLEERTSQLYWAERLLPELEPITAGGLILKVAPGHFSYFEGQRALWATVWLRENLYAFAFDRIAVEKAASRYARWSASGNAPVIVDCLEPDESVPADMVTRRSLSPWLPGWSLVARPRDVESLRASMARRRLRRILIIVTSISLIGVGAVTTARLVRREMALARMKTTFAANVSHELRSPITQIRLKGESLQLGLAETREDQEEHYDAIIREAERLSRLVDNVLDFAAIERGTKQYHLRPSDLSITLFHAVESMRSSMEARGLDLAVEIPSDLPAISHDPDAVAQAITNLLSNAAKYGGGEARISAVRLPDGVQVEVSDQGIGLDSAELERIFDRFYRSRNPLARRTKGTGIGLAIVKYIMEAHHGTVTVRSEPGEGSIFQLFFPLSTPTDSAGAR